MKRVDVANVMFFFFYIRFGMKEKTTVAEGREICFGNYYYRIYCLFR